MSETNKIIKYNYTWTEILKCARELNISPVFVTNVNGELVKWTLRASYMYYAEKTREVNFRFSLNCLSEYSSERAVSLTIHVIKDENIRNTYQEQFNRNRLLREKTCYCDMAVGNAKNYNGDFTLKDFSLKIICEITFEVPTVRIYDNSSATSPTDRGLKKLDNLEDYFESGKLGDVTIVAGGEEFRAHKLILSLRSKAFATMFSNDLWETSQAVIKIKDVDADVIREMLRFIYTGKIKDQDKFSGDLLKVADRYGIDDLKDLCTQELTDAVDSNNF